MGPRMMAARQTQPVSVTVPSRLVRKDFWPPLQATLLEICGQLHPELMHAVGAHGLGEYDEQVEPTDAVGIHQQRVESAVRKGRSPPTRRRQVAFLGNREAIVILVQVDIDGEPPRSQVARRT